MQGGSLKNWRAALVGIPTELLAPGLPSGPRSLSVAEPLARAGIEDFVAECRRSSGVLTVVINDGHRHTDTRGFLDSLFGMPIELPALRLLVAAGSHRAGEQERAGHLAAQAGPWLDRFKNVAWHDAYDDSALVTVGEAAYHAWMTEGGHYLGCGSMEPHYFAGITGAHKTLTIGVMSRDSIEANHAAAMSLAARPMKLEGNPVHEGVVRAIAALEASGARMFVLNQIIVDDQVVARTAGHPLTALYEGLGEVHAHYVKTVKACSDLVVACVRPPLDRDLYQADKGIKNTEIAVCDGGVLLLEADCGQGVGLDQFVDLLREAHDHETALAIVERRGYRLGDHKAVRLRRLGDGRGVRIGIVSRGLPPSLGDEIGLALFETPETAAVWARSLLPADARALLVEDAGNICIELDP